MRSTAYARLPRSVESSQGTGRIWHGARLLSRIGDQLEAVLWADRDLAEWPRQTSSWA